MEKFLTQWIEKKIALGEYFLPKYPGKSVHRLVVVPKFLSTTPKTATPDGLRVCTDFVPTNAISDKLVQVYPNPERQIQGIANLYYKFSADGKDQFKSIPLTPEASLRTDIWTPLGIARTMRMLFGAKNASAIAQNLYTRAINNPEWFPTKYRKFLFNFQDDFSGGHPSRDITQMAKVFCAFIDMCRKANITLKPEKLHVGYKNVRFFGWEVFPGGYPPTKENLDPVSKMVPPTNKKEVMIMMVVETLGSGRTSPIPKDSVKPACD